MGLKVSSQVVRLLRIASLFLVCLFICDQGIGYGLDYLYDNQRSGMFYRANYVVSKCKDQYLVFGSSRANHHYDPHVFELKTNSTFYNCGRDAQGIIYSCAMISAVIQRYSPELILIDVVPDEFTTTEEGRLGFLLPYYKHSAVRPYIRFNGPYENIKLWSAIYPYNSQLGSLMQGISAAREDQIYKGYLPLDGTMDMKVETNRALLSHHVDRAKVKVLERILLKLEEKKIHSLLVISPYYGKTLSGLTDNLCKKFAARFEYTKFVNFSNGYFNHNLFKDNYHLNRLGAKQFSAELADTILTEKRKSQMMNIKIKL